MTATLDELLHREPWMDDAMCAQTDPEAFFPEKGGSTRDAKKICASCDVQNQCLLYALQNDERFGIWGGLSERERREVRSGRKPLPAIPQRPERPHQVRSTIAVADRVVGFVRQGASDRQIAKRLRIDVAEVATYRKVAGLRANKEAAVRFARSGSGRRFRWTPTLDAELRRLNRLGLNDGQIGREMRIAYATVRTHRAVLGLPSNAKRGRPRKDAL